MKTNFIKLKVKVYNHLMKNGTKFLSEKIFLKSIKKLQKTYTKNHGNLIKFVVVFLAPLVKIKRIKNKKNKILKEFPYILNEKNRLTLSIKQIFKFLSGKKSISFHNKFAKEIFSISESKSQVLNLKKVDQEKIILKKKYSFYRWFY